MTEAKTILVVGTYDTKNDELDYMASRIRTGGGAVLTMDVSVLGDPERPTDYSKHDVAEAGGSSIQAAIDSGDENSAMQIMAEGACALATQLYREGKFDGVVILGGTMGTDLALDVCQGSAAWSAEIRRFHRLVQPTDPGRSSVCRYPDDPLGRRSLWPQFGLQIVSVSSSRGRSGRRKIGRTPCS